MLLLIWRCRDPTKPRGHQGNCQTVARFIPKLASKSKKSKYCGYILYSKMVDSLTWKYHAKFIQSNGYCSYFGNQSQFEKGVRYYCTVVGWTWFPRGSIVSSMDIRTQPKYFGNTYLSRCVNTVIHCKQDIVDLFCDTEIKGANCSKKERTHYTDLYSLALLLWIISYEAKQSSKSCFDTTTSMCRVCRPFGCLPVLTSLRFKTTNPVDFESGRGYFLLA